MNMRLMLVMVGLTLFGPSAVAQPLPGTPVDQAIPIEMAPASLPERFTFRAEYLLGWVEGTDSAPLATTSPVGTARSIAGVLGLPTTSTLFDGVILDGARSGVRLDGAWSFDARRLFAIEGGFWLLGGQDDSFRASSAANPILARPYFNAATGASESVLIAFPGESGGAFHVQADSSSLYGAHVALSEKVIETSWLRLDCLFGYRFYRFEESVRVQQTIVPTSANFVSGTMITSTDEFGSFNEFHGADWGLRAEIAAGRLSVGLLTKLAAGRVRRSVSIAGSQTTSVPGQTPITQTGGVLALSSNIGNFTENEWSVLPEFGVTVKYQLTDFIQISCGYTLLMLGEVARASEQIDQTIDPNLFPPAGAAQTIPARPTFSLSPSDVLVQFFNIGLGIRY